MLHVPLKFSEAEEEIRSYVSAIRGLKLTLYYTNAQGKVTIKFCQVRHVVNKHKLHKIAMTRTLSKTSGLFECIDFYLSGVLYPYSTQAPNPTN